MQKVIAEWAAVLLLMLSATTLIADGWDFKGPFGVAVNSKDIVYVAEIGNKRISKFTADGTWLGSIETIEGYGSLAGPFDVCVGPNDWLYITDTFGHRLLVLDADEKLQFVIGKDVRGTKPGEFAQPHCVTVNKAGEIFVSDTFNARIQKFSPEGEFISTWGRVGTKPGEFLYHGYLSFIDVDNEGFVYIREFDGGRMQKYTEDGEYVATFSERGVEEGQLDEGYGLSIIAGKIYCADTFESRIQVFSLDGEFLAAWDPGEANEGEFFNHPVDIALTSSGDLIVSDWKNNRVLKLNKEGKFLKIWGNSLKDVLAWQPPRRIDRTSRGPIKLAIYAGIDDATLKASHKAGVDIIYISLSDQYRDWDISGQIKKAEAMGIEIHPSIGCLTFGQGQTGNSDIFDMHPEWCLWKKGADEPMATILSWADPGARSFRVDHLVDRAQANGFQGIMLDYIRFLGTDYGYDPAIIDGFFKKYGVNPLSLPQDDKRWMQYRADLVTDFIVELRHKLAVTMPGRQLEISAYLAGDDPDPEVYLKNALQDWRTWASMGIVDTVHVAPYTRDLDVIYESVRRVRQAVPDRVRVNSFIACYGGNLNTPELLRKGFEAAIAGGADQITIYRSDVIWELDLWGAISEISRDVKAAHGTAELGSIHTEGPEFETIR